MAKVMNYAVLMLTLASLAAGCKKGGGVLEVSADRVAFPASGGECTIYAQDSFWISDMIYSYESPGGSDMTADNWISVSSEDVTELGFWKSVTIRAEENTSGSIRKCRMRLDAFDIATRVYITQYAD